MLHDNHFLIKYQSEEERIKFSELVLGLVRDLEIKNFHIEEIEAYKQSRILYNMHTIADSIDVTFEELRRTFLNYYEVGF